MHGSRLRALRIGLFALGAAALLPARLVLAGAPTAALPASCEAQGNLQFVCGPTAAEDLVRVEGTPWLIGSGLREPDAPGRLHLIDSANKRWEAAWPSRGALVSADTKRFPDCTAPPEPSAFSAHGLAIRKTGADRHSLLVVNHGGREAVEFFEISSRGSKPALTWVGCVRMPPDVYLNSVVQLPDGGFLATQFYSASDGGMAKILTGAVTGGVLEWRSGRNVVEIPGTGLSGANGIEIASRGRVIYVAAWGTREIVRFDRRGKTLQKDVVSVGDFAPDNLRWTPRGQLLVAGQRFQPGETAVDLQGWRIVSVSPETLAITPVHSADATVPLQGASVALEVDGQIWVGPFRGDRVGYLPVPR